jgi:hypothetical protein
MAKEPKQVSFDEFASKVRTIFDNVAREGKAILIERKGQTYRLELERAEKPEALWTGYDPAAVRHGLRKSAGALVEADREALLREIQQAREQASHGRSS